MTWSEITGIINFDPGDITEDQFLGVYELFSHNFKGSEGGLNVSFTKTKRKNWVSSSEEDYYVDDIHRIENVTVTGSLRHIDEEGVVEMVKTLKDFLYQVRDRMSPNVASFVVRWDNLYWNVSIVNGRVRVQKVKMYP